MATFMYIGTITKDDGTVDVLVPKSDGTSLFFTQVVPNVTILDVGIDSFAINSLEQARDLYGAYCYSRAS